MSDIKRLVIGIILVFIALVIILGGAGGIMPYIGGLLGIIGSYLTIRVLMSGNLK